MRSRGCGGLREREIQNRENKKRGKREEEREGERERRKATAEECTRK